MASNSTATTTAPAAKARRNKRRPVIAFALATLAIGGMGAALTSAAWTDNVFFSAQTQAANFSLQGSLNGTDWSAPNTQGTALVIPAATFANLLPGDTRTITLHVRNQGSVSAALTGTAVFATGSTFTTNPGLELGGLVAKLAPAGDAAATDAFTLTVKVPADWNASNQSGTGSVIVQIQGTATQ